MKLASMEMITIIFMTMIVVTMVMMILTMNIIVTLISKQFQIMKMSFIIFHGNRISHILQKNIVILLLNCGKHENAVFVNPSIRRIQVLFISQDDYDDGNYHSDIDDGETYDAGGNNGDDHIDCLYDCHLTIAREAAKVTALYQRHLTVYFTHCKSLVI